MIAAVRVPPSAWITSQSMVTVRSPRASMSTTARSDLPMSRWISTERPSRRPTSRCRRVSVERGSIPYSAVTQPRFWPRRKPGTPSSTEAAHSTRVAPVWIIADPSA